MAQNTHPEADSGRHGDGEYAFRCTTELVVEIGPPPRHTTPAVPGWHPIIYSINGRTFHGLRETENGERDQRFVGRKILSTDGLSRRRDLDPYGYALLRIERDHDGIPVVQFALTKRDLRVIRIFLTT